MRYLSNLLLFLLATCVPAMGIPLRVLPWDDQVAERKLSIAHGSKIQETGYLHPGARSKAINVPSEAVDLRLQVNDRTDEEGKPLAMKLRLPSGSKSPLLLLLPDEKSPTGLRSIIIEDDTSAFRWGTIRLINVTPKPLVFRWGKKAQTIEPGWKPVSISPGGDTRNLEIFLYLKTDLKNPLYTAVWEHRDDMRQLVFMVPSKDSTLGPVEFKFIPETKVDEEAKAEAPRG